VKALLPQMIHPKKYKFTFGFSEPPCIVECHLALPSDTSNSWTCYEIKDNDAEVIDTYYDVLDMEQVD
jgi:hypothetical protein